MIKLNIPKRTIIFLLLLTIVLAAQLANALNVKNIDGQIQENGDLYITIQYELSNYEKMVARTPFYSEGDFISNELEKIGERNELISFEDGAIKAKIFGFAEINQYGEYDTQPFDTSHNIYKISIAFPDGMIYQSINDNQIPQLIHKPGTNTALTFDSNEELVEITLDENTEPVEDISITIINPSDGFYTNKMDHIEAQVTGNIDEVVFYIDGSEEFRINEEPYMFFNSPKLEHLGPHRIKAVGVSEYGSVSDEIGVYVIDLFIKDSQAVQVLLDYPTLVAGKSTAVITDFYINGLPSDKELPEIKLTLTYAQRVYTETINPNHPINPINGKMIFRKNLGDESYRFIFYPKPHENEGEYKYTIEINPVGGLLEQNKLNNIKTVDVDVVDTNGLDIIYVPIYHLGNEEEEEYVNSGIYNEFVNEEHEFMMAVFPFDEDEVQATIEKYAVGYPSPGPYSLTELNQLDLLYHLQTYSSFISLTSNRVVGVAHIDFIHKYNSKIRGFSNVGARNAVAIGNDNPTKEHGILLHELGHTFGLPSAIRNECGPLEGCEEYNENKFPEPYLADDGFWVNKGREVIAGRKISNIMNSYYTHITSEMPEYPGLRIWSNTYESYESEDLGYKRGDVSPLKNDGMWIDNETYTYLLSYKMNNVDPEILLVGGIIYKNDTVDLFDWHYFPEGTIYDVPSGEYSIVLLDENNRILHTTPFDDTGYITSDASGFSFPVPFIEGTKNVEVRKNAKVLTSVSVSKNAPVIEITNPIKDETISDTYDITWIANDLDGDYLSYILSLSDDGTTWSPIAMGLSETHFNLNSSLIAGGTYKIKVTASDMINTGESISIGSIRIGNKKPHARIDYPNESAIFTGNNITFKGYGYDREDGVLKNSSLIWESNIDGVIGTGADFVTDLHEGSHTITLIVKDSQGGSNSASIIIDVKDEAKEKSIGFMGFSLIISILFIWSTRKFT